MNNGKIARISLGLIFIYHGLVPKIFFYSEIEQQLILAHGETLPFELLSKTAGVLEAALGSIIAASSQYVWPVKLAIVILAALLIDVAMVRPALLAEAFNPVTTNLAGIVLGIIAIRQPKESLHDRT